MNLTIKESEIKRQGAVYAVPYCGLSNHRSLLRGCPMLGHSRGIYGWKCNYYLINNGYREVIISEGYAPVSSVTKRAQKEFDELVKKYTAKAERLEGKWPPDEKAYARLSAAFKKAVLEIENWRG